MRRSARGEQSAFSLFPFLAVLLCTMGSMVVLLVAIAHVARTKAQREAELASVAAEQAQLNADSPERREAEAKLAEAERFAEQLQELTAKGNERLQQEQAKLSAIEDHLRRLKDEAERLKAETFQLIAVEQEHYDDEKIAREEIQRLNELIGEIEEEIEEAKHAATGRERRFAVVPLRDNASGTIRPPIYFECTADGVTLQPEGIELTWADLVASKFSSPMAAASRAVTRYYEEHPEARAANEAGPPYTLLIVRPDGVEAYYGAREALESVGASYGYQPVGEDWPIEYDPPNPVLSQWVDEAIATARRERLGLAQVIPQLARQLSLAKLGPPSARGSANTSLAGAGQGGDGIRVSRADPEAANPFEGMRIEGSRPASNSPSGGMSQDAVASNRVGSTPGDPGGQPSGPSLGAASQSSRGGASDSRSAAQPFDEVAGGGPAGPSGDNAESTESEQAEQADPSQLAVAGTTRQTQPSDQAKQGETDELAEQANGSGAGSRSESSQAPGTAVAVSGTPSDPRQRRSGTGTQDSVTIRSRDGVPMIRPIRLYVAADRVVVLPDRAQSATVEIVGASGPQSVRFDGPTTDRINEVIAALKRHADSWGIAGSDMYWDPRLVLNVTSDGADRAEELTELLEAAGLKVQTKPVATAAYPNTSGGTGATR